MNRLSLVCAIGSCLAALAAPLHAQEPALTTCAGTRGAACNPCPGCVPPGCWCPPFMPSTPGQATPDSTMPGQGESGAQTPGMAGDAFAQAPEAGTQPAASFNPGMFGDLLGPRGVSLVPAATVSLPGQPPSTVGTLPGQPQQPSGPTTGATPGGNPANPSGNPFLPSPARSVSGNLIAIAAPLAFRSSFKIAENESPRPIDRVFTTYNFFSDVDRSFLAVNGLSSNLHREMAGFEKTFLQGNASVGMRVPILQLTGNPDLIDSHFGDISVVFKYAFINNPPSGNVLSAGMVLTAPTGQGLHIDGQSTVNPTIFQPWVGGIYNWNNLFVQNFMSLAVPTDARDVTLFFKSVGLGYWLYRTNEPDRILTAVVPDAELHLSTPLNHRGLSSIPIGFPDTLNFTGGFYFFLRRAVLGIAVGAPLTGPKPYDYEVNTNLNFRF